MSIDLRVALTRSLAIRPLLPKAGAVLAEMLGLQTAPDLIVQVLENGRPETADSAEIRDETSPFLFLISTAGKPESVALNIQART